MRERHLPGEAQPDAASALVGRVEGQENVLAPVVGDSRAVVPDLDPADLLAELGVERHLVGVFAAFSILAVIIGCLGLFGLAAFTAERRTKEIGIRKELGARTQDIVRLLVWQFSRPVLIANVIAWPIAWWLMRDWLNGFDQRIPLTPIPFLLAAAVALGIAIATVVGHAVRVARANPIHALRYE